MTVAYHKWLEKLSKKFNITYNNPFMHNNYSICHNKIICSYKNALLNKLILNFKIALFKNEYK